MGPMEMALTGQILTGQVLTGQVLTGQVLTGQVPLTGTVYMVGRARLWARTHLPRSDSEERHRMFVPQIVPRIRLVREGRCQYVLVCARNRVFFFAWARGKQIISAEYIVCSA